MSVQILKTKRGDMREVLRRSPAAKMPNAEMILDQCIARSVVFQGIIDGDIAAIWGAIAPTLMSDTAYLWLLTTDLIDEHKFTFIRHSKIFVDEILKQYPVLVGDVILPNPHAVQWLKWLGAKFSEKQNGKMSFEIRAKNG